MTALRIGRLATRGFRNLGALNLEPGPQFNVIHGDNGAGKSNLLEAIYYLGALRSFRGAKTDDLIGTGEPRAVLKSQIHAADLPRTYGASLTRGKARKLTLDDKRPRTIATWRASVQMVLFHPGDLVLAMGGPDARRVYLDRILEQMDATYGSTLASYTKALRSRNRLLKQDDVDRRAVTAFDELLANAGAIIGQTRRALIDDLTPRVERAFLEVVGEEVSFSMRYAPRVPPDPDAIRAKLIEAYPKDRARGFTADGPHADDIALEVNTVTAKHHASQGQHRAIVLALKIAELDVLADRVGRVPILLLDDVSSELDRSRNRRLFELLAKLGGQVFLTTTHPEFILLEENRVDFRVESGTVVLS